MTFGDYIRVARENLGWTQPAAAGKIGIEQSYLSKLETGKSYPSEDMFTRLAEVYDIDVDNMTASLEDGEAAKLKAVPSVQSSIIAEHQKHQAQSRRWLMAGLVSLALSGTSLGTALIPDSSERRYLYRSHGVLLNSEPLSVLDAAASGDDEVPAELMQRLDPVDQIASSFRGDRYIETLPDGRRAYRFIGESEASGQSTRRFFLAPALAFLFAAVGCFGIGFRNKS